MSLVCITADEHNRGMPDCHGHQVIRTPNLDRPAARDVRFTSQPGQLPT